MDFPATHRRRFGLKPHPRPTCPLPHHLRTAMWWRSYAMCTRHTVGPCVRQRAGLVCPLPVWTGPHNPVAPLAHHPPRLSPVVPHPPPSPGHRRRSRIAWRQLNRTPGRDGADSGAWLHPFPSMVCHMLPLHRDPTPRPLSLSQGKSGGGKTTLLNMLGT